MNNFSHKCLIFSVILVCVAPYSLPGSWILKNLDGQPNDSGITLDIFESVNKNNQVRNTLHFSNCHHITYEVIVQQNFMWVDNATSGKTNSSTSQSDSNGNNQCSQEDSKLEQRISQSLKKVFFFAIKSDLLVFVSPNGNDLFEFSRVKKVYLTKLNGDWLLDIIYWQRASLSAIKIQDQKATFCDGKIQTSYKTDNIDQIEFNITKNDNCSQANLSKALEQITYYRLKDMQLYLYDQNSIPIMQIAYISEGNGLQANEKIIGNGAGLTQANPSSQVNSINIISDEDLSKLLSNPDNNLRSQPSSNNI